VTDFENIKEELKGYFKLRGYEDLTINLYVSRLIDLFKYYPTTEPKLITESQINKYISVLANRKLSYSTVNQFIQSAEYYFNHINKHDYRLNKKLLPPKKDKVFDILTQEQIFLIIDNIQNIKHKAIVALLYSCGLELSEIINIRIIDINSKSKPPKLSVRDKQNIVVRQVVISFKVINILREYWKQYQPKNWLFEGQNSGEKYTISSARKIVSDSFENAGFIMDAEVKVLKQSHIKHLTDLGVPLVLVLNNLGIRSFEAHEKYTKLIYDSFKIEFTPYDRIVGNSEINEIEIENLESIVFLLENEDEKKYLIEALSCFRVGALRAGIVFSWIACVRFLQNKCIEKGYDAINEALHNIFPKAKPINSLDDFETIKDSTILSIAFELRVISKHIKGQLDNDLDLRNYCGHPSSYNPEINKAKAFIEDIVNVMKKK